MLNITLDVNDFYFSYGLESLLRENEGLSEHEVNISYGLDDKSVGHADIIVTTFLAGEAYICHDIFKKRKSGGVVNLHFLRKNSATLNLATFLL